MKNGRIPVGVIKLFRKNNYGGDGTNNFRISTMLNTVELRILAKVFCKSKWKKISKLTYNLGEDICHICLAKAESARTYGKLK